VEAAAGAGHDEHGADASAPLRYGQMIQGLSAVIAPATLLTGIAFYFGWQRVRAFDNYFGLNPGAVGYSTRDYVLNSLDALFLPVMVVLLTLIALALAHAYIGRVQRGGGRPDRLRRLSELGLWVGTVLLLVGGVGAFGAFPFHTPYLIATLFPAAGVLLLAHSVDLHARLRHDPPISPAGRVFVALFVAVCLFWAAGFYAGTVGRNQAASLARHLDELPGVTMSGASDLAPATGGDASGGSVRGGKAPTARGFRLLAVENGTLFLLPDGWKAKRGQLFTVAEADAKGLAFTPGKVHLTSAVDAAGTGDQPISGGGAGVSYGPVRRVAALSVEIDTSPGSAVVQLMNRTSRPISGISLVGTLAKHVQPFVTGAGAACRVGRPRFSCSVNAIPAGHKVLLTITYRAHRYVGGNKLSVRVGSARKSLSFVLSR
jgi:hypothetical protein